MGLHPLKIAGLKFKFETSNDSLVWRPFGSIYFGELTCSKLENNLSLSLPFIRLFIFVSHKLFASSFNLAVFFQIYQNSCSPGKLSPGQSLSHKHFCYINHSKSFLLLCFPKKGRKLSSYIWQYSDLRN